MTWFSLLCLFVWPPFLRAFQLLDINGTINPPQKNAHFISNKSIQCQPKQSVLIRQEAEWQRQQRALKIFFFFSFREEYAFINNLNIEPPKKWWIHTKKKWENGNFPFFSSLFIQLFYATFTMFRVKRFLLCCQQLSNRKLLVKPYLK